MSEYQGTRREREGIGHYSATGKSKIEQRIFYDKKNTLVYITNKDLLSDAKYLDAKLSDALGFSVQISEGSGKGVNLVIPDVAEKRSRTGRSGMENPVR